MTDRAARDATRRRTMKQENSGRGRLAGLVDSRVLTMAALTGIYIFLLILLVPFVVYNNLLKGDGAGHLMLVEFTAEYLLPWGAGWCGRVWGGFPAGQLYPPLFHIVAGALSLIIGAVPAVKAVVVAVWLAIPLGLLRLAKVLTPESSRQSPTLTASLLLAGWCGLNVPSGFLGISLTLGTNLESTVGNGMYPSALGFLFFLLLAGELLSPRKQHLRIALLLAAAVCSHPIWGMVGALAATLTAGFDLVRRLDNQRRAALLVWCGTAAMAILCAGFFVVPFLVHMDLVNPTHLGSHWPVRFWVFIASGLAFVAYRWQALENPARILAAAAAGLVLAVAIGDWAGWAFHLYRLTIPITFMLLPALFSALRGQERFARVLPAANLVMLLVLAGLVQIAGPVFPAGNPGLHRAELPGYQRTAGRIMVLTEDLHSPGYMAVPYAVTSAGAAVSHGISVESGFAAQAIFGLVRKLNSKAYVWGVDMVDNPVTRVPDPDLKIARRQLELLGFSHVLTDRRPESVAPYGAPAGPIALRFPNFVAKSRADAAQLDRTFFLSPSKEAFEYRLLPLHRPGLVECGLNALGVPLEHFGRYALLWFANGGEAPVPVAGLEGPLVPVANAECSVTDISPSGDAVRLVAACPSAQAPCPIYAKVPYHPHWSATHEDGGQITLLRAGFGMLALARHGEIQLQYEAGRCVQVGRTLTIIGFLVLCVVGAIGWKRRRITE